MKKLMIKLGLKREVKWPPSRRFSKIKNFLNKTFSLMKKIGSGIISLFTFPVNSFSSFISSLSKVIIHLIVLIFIILLGQLVYDEISKYETLMVKSFNVPKALHDYGIDGDTIANHIMDELNKIKTVRTRYKPGVVAKLDFLQNKDIIIKGPEYSLNIETLKMHIKKFFGKEPTIISGDILIHNLDIWPIKFTLTARISDREKYESKEITIVDYKKAIEDAVAHCLRKTHPYILGLYYYQTKTDNEKKRLLKNEMNKKLCDKNKVQKIAKSSKNDDLQNMRDIADEAINKDPGKPWGYNLRGLIEYYYGERADAEYFLNMSLKVTDDKFAAGYSNLGRLHHKYFEYQRAIKEFEMALEKGEDDLEVLFLLIDSYYEEGLYEKVRARCKELIDQKFTLNYWRKCHEIDLRTGVH